MRRACSPVGGQIGTVRNDAVLEWSLARARPSLKARCAGPVRELVVRGVALARCTAARRHLTSEEARA